MYMFPQLVHCRCSAVDAAPIRNAPTISQCYLYKRSILVCEDAGVLSHIEKPKYIVGQALILKSTQIKWLIRNLKRKQIDAI